MPRCQHRDQLSYGLTGVEGFTLFRRDAKRDPAMGFLSRLVVDSLRGGRSGTSQGPDLRCCEAWSLATASSERLNHGGAARKVERRREKRERHGREPNLFPRTSVPERRAAAPTPVAAPSGGGSQTFH